MEKSEFVPILVSERPLGGQAPRRARRPNLAPRRVALAIVVGAVAAVLLARIAGAAIRPLVVSFQAGRDVRRLQADAQRQEKRRARLLAEIAYLRTPAGVEEEARRQGWVREGETAIQVIRPQDRAATSGEGAPARPQRTK